MIRLTGTVEYEDGTAEDFETGSAALAAYELYALRHGYPIGTAAPPMLSSLVVAHHALGKAEGFDTWRAKVSGVELNAGGENGTGAVPPTLPEPS